MTTARTVTARTVTARTVTARTVTGDPGTHGEMRLSVMASPAHTIVSLRGDLDVATAPELRERLLAVLRPGMRLLVLDLSQVWVCDAAGAAVLIGAQRRATALRTTFRLAAPRSQVAKVLRSTGLDRHLTIYPTLSNALIRPLPGPSPTAMRGTRRPSGRARCAPPRPPTVRTRLANPDRTRGPHDLPYSPAG